MGVTLPSGTTLQGFNEVTVDIHEVADLMKRYKDALKRVADLERLNSVLVDSAESNKILRENAIKAKRECALLNTKATILNGAARALWKTANFKIGPIQDDGTRMLTISPKDGRADLKFCQVIIPISAERASYIEPVFKPDGTFLAYNDIYKRQREEVDQRPQKGFYALEEDVI